MIERISLLTAGDWFTIFGALMTMLGVALLLMLIPDRKPRRRRRPVRVITQARLHEISLDPRPSPYGRHDAAGVTVVDSTWAASPRTRVRDVPSRTVIMPRVAPPRPASKTRRHR